MRRAARAILITAAALAATPGAAAANSGSLSLQVFGNGATPYVDADISVTRTCPDASDCAWFAELRLVAPGAACTARGDTPWVGPLDNGPFSRRYLVRYPTSTGPRSERACLLVWHSERDEPALVTFAEYVVPGPGSQPAGGGDGSGAPGSGSGAPSDTGSAADAPFGPSLFEPEVKRALRAALTRRYGARWLKARKPLLKCVRTTRGSFRCRVWWRRGGRWHSRRARVFAAEGARVVANFT